MMLICLQDRADKPAEAIAAVVIDATQHFDQALTAERLFRWHRMLFPTGEAGLDPITVGAWRTDASGPMQVVSGRPGRQQIHVEGPPADRVPAEGSVQKVGGSRSRC